MKLVCAKCNKVPTWVSIPDQHRPDVRHFRAICHGEEIKFTRTVPNYRDMPANYTIKVFEEKAG